MPRLIALIAMFACAPVLAQEYRGPYVGLGIANVDYEDNFLFWFDVGETATAPRLFGGFRFNEKLAFEAVYTDGADFSGRLSGTAPIFLDSNRNAAGGPYTANYTGSFESIEVRVLAHTRYMLYGISYFSSDFKGRLVGSTAPPPITGMSNDFVGVLNDSDTGYSIVIGAQFDIGNWAVRPEYEYYDVSSPSDATALSVLFSYKF